LESARLLRKSEDKLALGETLRNISFREAELNDYEQAVDYLKESESLFREMGHLTGMLEVLGIQAQYAIWQGDLNTARMKLDESLTIQDVLGPGNNFFILMLLGDYYYWQGDYEQARDNLEKSLAISKDNSEISTRNWIMARLGYTLLRQGQLDQAYNILGECLRLFREAGVRIGVVFSLEGLGKLAIILAEPDLAARLAGWTDMEREAIQDSRPPIEQKDLDRDIAAAEEMMGREAHAAAYAEGRSMRMDEAIALALALDPRSYRAAG
jgi:tetratricopeptide (TPR) repeat protein